MRALVASAAAAAILVAASPAVAQTRGTRNDRGFIAVNGGIQNAAGTMQESFEYEVYAENASVDVSYPGKTAALFDGGIGFRVWRQLGIAVAASRSTASGTASVDARIPHPFFLNQHRSVEGETGDISRTETAAHVQLYYEVPMRGRWRVRLAAGPSFFNAEQEIVETIDVAESYPFDTAEYRSALTRRAKGSGPGFNAGIDVSWMLSRRLGIGALARYARASLDLNASDVRTVSSDAGGFQAGGGLRIGF